MYHEKAKDIVRIMEAASALGIPCTASLGIEGRFIVPKVPFIAFGSRFFTTPDDLLREINPSAMGKLTADWQRLVQGITYLANPFTGLRHLDGGAPDAAVNAFSGGIAIADGLPGAKVILPRSVGINPAEFAGKDIISEGNLTFRYNSWSPPTAEELIPVENRGKDGKIALGVNFTLTTNTGTRDYTFPMRTELRMH
ncbi:MAG: hypothetical protein UV61_C0009G0010 [Candidatus Gottesmanbacteria bacterium GW2011_GWB1_43_11]|uniref:Uncharacterized protein n=1 Tax=Candidatus Gottesmanbacteria bacterium GW2011_GWB1_43_11 TaxID=1618446 RepID=A0A0G1FHZ9_9BACT|nr:MAG: hypothetical protein UV17_C0024G0007 [Candidatus Gottesmanbacteria bacterium GW2011_GWA1_42_26]KKS81364.1 MAG: hypothetical protein UV55_C0015G0010 [Candidatus Gottesmanbacteria bacterium GW2011_GWC1_43_10]KKS86483.1 MAG: hypothetical protein UV61_C0009G0010 [Candidatus Gottesmanbacteria bacterium GW2011_GWB1_43_11]OGG10446.1 MAG: hypothetical protein A2699_04385 [Candidatus Gottesmanbacteria bacterium RIFCSPHIGHO2_01_FULL_43_15]OGG28157.1 MAG: hypothetical protein A3A59_03970 [Candidat